MNPLHAAILGILQGLTEVLPISSSAHLILVPWAFRWPESGLTFDVALHLGTLIALCLYFRRDIAMLASEFFRTVRGRPSDSPGRLLPFFIIAGSVPAALVGKFLETPIEELFRGNPAVIAAFLILFGLLLALSDRIGMKRWNLERINLKSSLIIGLAQALALVPGVSRSGITITAALFLGYDREAAARFSFLLSLPIVAGAAVLKLGHLLKHGVPANETSALVIGIVTSAVFGYLSVAFLLKFVQKYSLYSFTVYRIIAGVAVFAYLAVG